MDKWFAQPVIVNIKEGTAGEGCIDFHDEVLDFTKGYEMALLEAHVGLMPSQPELSVTIGRALNRNCEFQLPAHAIRTVDD